MLFRCDGYPLHVKSTKIKYLFRARARASGVRGIKHRAIYSL